MNNYTIEINNATPVTGRLSNDVNGKRLFEISSALIMGKDTSKMDGAQVDSVVKFLKDRGTRAAGNDYNARAELNAVFTQMVEPPVLQAIGTFGLISNYIELGYQDALEVEAWDFENAESRMQAYNGDVAYPSYTWRKYQVSTSTISAGMAVDYRELALGNFDSKIPAMIQRVQTDMTNKAMKLVVDTVTSAVKNNSEYVKFYTEYSTTPTQTQIDEMIAKIRRLGEPVIMADYSNIAMISGWNGYKVIGSDTVPFYNEGLVNDMMTKGITQYYKGARLAEIPNPYNLTAPKSDKTAFETYYDTDLIFILPSGQQSPLYTVRRGNMTTMFGSDITTGRQLTRFDLEIGATVIKGHEYKIGMLDKA